MTQTFTCGVDSLVPTSAASTGPWKWSCQSSDGETSSQEVVLDGAATLTVAGSAVRTEQVSIHSTLSGSVTGASDTEDWLNGVGLRIKETGDVNASADGVSFKSTYSLSLDSLTPS